MAANDSWNWLFRSIDAVFVIAEAGVNHDGKLDKALKLVDAAAEAGADCVKFQTFNADRLTIGTAPKAAYQLRNTNQNESQYDMLKALELSTADLEKVISHCQVRNIVFLSTPYSFEDVDLLDSMDVSGFKLASLHAAEPAFLSYTAMKGRPLILSTGMTTLAEIDTAVQAIRSTGNENFALLQCTTNYPADPQEANLKVMQTMSTAFGVTTGYSDHTPGHVASIAAVALGARIIEKHLTLDRTSSGPDHSTSLEPAEMLRLVEDIRQAEQALGDGIKMPTSSEWSNRSAMRRSLVAARDIEPETSITMDMLMFMRPGDGIPVADLDRVIGSTTNSLVKKGSMLQWSKIIRHD